MVLLMLNCVDIGSPSSSHKVLSRGCTNDRATSPMLAWSTLLISALERVAVQLVREFPGAWEFSKADVAKVYRTGPGFLGTRDCYR